MMLLEITGAFQQPRNPSVGFVVSAQENGQQFGAQVALGIGKHACVRHIFRRGDGADDIGVLDRKIGGR